MVVLLCTVPADDFVLSEVLDRLTDTRVEFEHVVPTNHGPLPYLWIDDAPVNFDEAFETDPSVAAAERAATFDGGSLYRIDWRVDRTPLLEYLAIDREHLTLLSASVRDGEWLLKVRFPSRAAFSGFRSFYQEHDIALRVVRLYDLTRPGVDEYDLSEKQREGIVRALEMGYFEIPREATLEQVADSLGITPKSLSERLRRGQSNLFRRSLATERPSGVGVNEP